MVSPPNQTRTFWLVAVSIFSFAGVALIVGSIWIGSLEKRSAEIEAESSTRAFDSILASYGETEASLLSVAQRIAGNEQIISGLRALNGRDNLNNELVRFFADLQPGARNAVELYTIAPRLLAWKGFGMPLDDAPSSDSFLDSYQVTIARDGDKRTALVVWYPVRDGMRVTGVVRAMRQIEFNAPVQNQYLKSYNWTTTWRRLTGTQIRFESQTGQTQQSAAVTSTEHTNERSILLTASDGSVLGRIYAADQDFVSIRQALSVRVKDVGYFFVALAWAWLMFGFALLVKHQNYSWISYLGFCVALWLTRFGLLALDIPGRYQTGRAPFSAVFDPTHLASEFGFGLMRSSGDFFFTTVFALVFAFMTARVLNRRAREIEKLPLAGASRTLIMVFGFVVVFELIFLLARLGQRVVFDSTLDLFALSGLLPEPLVLLVFGSTLLAGLAVVILASSVFRFAGTLFSLRRPSSEVIPFVFVIAVAGLWIYARLTLTSYEHPTALLLVVYIGFLIVVALASAYRGNWSATLNVRNVLPTIFVLAALVYPFLYKGVDLQTRSTMSDAVEFFDQGRDSRVVFALERTLSEASDSPAVVAAIRSAELVNTDSLAGALLMDSYATSVGDYDLSLVIADNDGKTIGRFYESTLSSSTPQQLLQEEDDFAIGTAMYDESGTGSPLVELVTGSRERDRFIYQGVSKIWDGNNPVGWILMKAEPRLFVDEGTTPFPKVLVPTSAVSGVSQNISLAEFRDDVLVRSTGRDFGRYRLDQDVRRVLDTSEDHWRTETIREKPFLTYYKKNVDGPQDILPTSIGSSTSIPVVAARIPAITVFDHLYFLLRITVAGIGLAIPAFLAGFFLRRYYRNENDGRVRFRDKVLNAFFAVGIVTVTAMAIVGLNVITGENDRAVQSWLKQHLERVEETLALDAETGELPFRVLERVNVDSLAGRVSLDINVYRGTILEQSSRPQLIRDRLISERLPMNVYRSLYMDGFRFASSDQQLGTFAYTAGYRAFPDESGRPRYVVSVPTLPEQERIEEERARTIAYLFGSLLLLVLVVMITASLLANALTRPIGRLREGLERVARGRFEKIPALDTGDEIGELVDSFNVMQDELSESQQKLARQERELAWQEMARQVAHEIKNPLTPMKLSIQHLRRAYSETKKSASQEFSTMFDRVTTTLTEQVDALARIANEFSSFGRMPHRRIDKVDLNLVLTEAAELMRANADATIELNLDENDTIIAADKEELRRATINLIKNGIQSTPDGREVQIHITSQVMETNGAGTVRVEISDNGSGIPEEVKERIFEPNFSTKTSGTGLGLAIVRKTVEELGGTIGFNTVPDEGSTFFFTLPIARH